MSRGDYLVRIEGENLKNINSNSIYILYAEFDDGVKAKDLITEERVIEYKLSSKKDLSSLELGIMNTTHERISINKLQIIDNSEFILTDALKRWWKE